MKFKIPHWLTPKEQGSVAQRQPWLYAYIAFDTSILVIGIFRLVHKYFALPATNNPYFSQTEQRSIMYITLAFVVVLQLAIMTYLYTARQVRNVLLLLKILLAFEILGLVTVILKPSAYSLVASTLQTGFTTLMILLLRRIKEPEVKQKKPSKANVKQIKDSEDQARFNVKHPVLLTIGAVISVLLICGIVLGEYANYAYRADVLHARTFTASKYNFSIDFPGKVSTATSTTQAGCNNDSFPFTQYSSAIDNNTQTFVVNVIPWPAQDADFVDMSPSALKSSLAYIIKTDMQFNNAHLVNTRLLHVAPNNTLAEEAEFTLPGKGFTVTGYERVFTVGNTEYAMAAQDAGHAAFDVFADSFQFTGPSSSYKRKSNFPSNSIDAACTAQLPGSGDAYTANQPTGVPSPSDGTVANNPTGQPTTGTWANEPSGVPTNGTVSNGPTNQGETLPGNTPLQVAP